MLLTLILGTALQMKIAVTKRPAKVNMMMSVTAYMAVQNVVSHISKTIQL